MHLFEKYFSFYLDKIDVLTYLIIVIGIKLSIEFKKTKIKIEFIKEEGDLS